MFVFFWGKKKAAFLIGSIFLLITIVCTASYSSEMVFKQRKPIYQGNPGKKNVAVTVNVDWGEEHLPGMLDLFKKNGVKATFFVSGRWAGEHPQLVQEIARCGHEIGNHGFSHPHVNDLSLPENIEEIRKTQDVIAGLTQKRTRYFAPPYGEFNEVVLDAAAKTEHKVILWTVDTIDWRKPPPETIVSRVLSNVHNGAIILMHPTDPTLKALPEICKGLDQQGYQITPLEKLISD